MKFFATRSTTQFRQLIIRSMQHIIANVTLFNAFKSLVNISFPQGETVQNRSILQYKNRFINERPLFILIKNMHKPVA